MTLPGPRQAALFLSTTPPLPRDYGNRNRVHQTLSFFEDLGFTASFLLYPFDRDWAEGIPPYYAELSRRFEYFAAIPNSRPLHQNAGGYCHRIDDWWDHTIGQHLSWLCARRHFDMVFVNYPFLSKAFDYVPNSALKILDTHDRFAGRRELFERHGVAPEFFYTTAEQEKIAFDRADIVIAIKHSEALTARDLTRRKVICIPYSDDRETRPEARGEPPGEFDHDRPLRLGFIGAYNSVNIVNLRKFVTVFARYVSLYNAPVEIVVAGNVCDGLDDSCPFLTKLGYVADVAQFYRDVDAIVAPLSFSTGIKIKVGEALAYGLPVLATRDAFDGFRSFHATQQANDIEALCEAVVAVAYGEVPMAELSLAARRARQAAALAQARGFTELRSWGGLAPRRHSAGVDRDKPCGANKPGARSRAMLDILDKAHHPKSQINRRQAAVIARVVAAFAGEMNLLVFGLGHDMSFWQALNPRGNTLFVEQSDQWIAAARGENPDLDVLQLDYRGWTVANSMPIDLDRLEAEPIPPRIKGSVWDAIVVDAPLGTHAEAPGRALPIYWAHRMMASHTQLFIDDAERDLEKSYSQGFFPADRFTQIAIPRATNSPQHMLWIARFV